MANRSGKEFSGKTKTQAFDLAGGCCRICKIKLLPGNIEYHHELEAELGGTNDLSNCMPLCIPCHAHITATKSIPVIRKSDRQKRKHINARSPVKTGLEGRSREQKHEARAARTAGRIPLPPRRMLPGFVPASGE